MYELIAIFIGIVSISTFLSMSEVAILTVNPVKMKQLATEKPFLNFFIENKSKISSQIITANWLSDFIGAMLLSSLISAQYPDNQTAVFIVSGITTVITLYIATLFAKLYSANHAETVLRRMGRFIIIVYWVLKPIVLLISGPALFVLQALLKEDGNTKLSDAELLGVLAIANKEGVLADKQHTLIKHLMTLQTKKVSDILPKDQAIEAVDIEDDILNLGAKLFEDSHKRIVVTKSFKDQQYPVGILLFGDIARININHAKRTAGNDESLPVPSIARLMRPCVVTQEDEDALVLLDKLDKGEHIVVAVNVDGQMTGVLQSDDIIRALTKSTL